MSSTITKIGNNIKNWARNITAGLVLANTVATTDLAENFVTTATRPTSNVLETIENTAQSLGNTMKNTSQGNIFHTLGNTATLLPRAMGSTAEGIVKTLGHVIQPLSGLNQIVNNSAITLGDASNQSFSTTDASPDIPHKEIHLKDPTPLWRDGTHGILSQKEPPKTKIGSWLGNVKNSLFNIPLNVGRIATDVIAYTAQRARWVIESIEWTAKDIKSARSGVFTKGQSFGKKVSNIFTKGIRWSAKGIVKWVGNIINEWVLKSGVAVIWVGTNFIGRTLGNTLSPLFSMKAGREQKDNFFDWTSRHDHFQKYYTSTPRKAHSPTLISSRDKEVIAQEEKIEKEEVIQETEKKEDQKESLKEKTINKTTKQKEKNDDIVHKKKEFTNTWTAIFLWSLDWWITTIDSIKKSHKEKDKESLDRDIKKLTENFITYKDDIISSDLTEQEKKNWKTITATLEDIANGKYSLSEESQVKESKKEWEETKKEESSHIESNEAMREHIIDRQRVLVKEYNENNKNVSQEKSNKRIKSLQWYINSGGEVIFSWKTGRDDKIISWLVASLSQQNANIIIQGKTDTQEIFTTTIEDAELFSPSIGFSLPEKK